MTWPEVPSPEQRADARRLYGADAVGYEKGRPDYPDRVFDLLAERCGLRPGASVLEIGPGTGRVTRHLLLAGARVIALEPDPALAEYLRNSGGLDMEIRQETFEESQISDAGFDLIVAAMSFHWVDQAIGLPKLGRIVRPDGWVALWWTLFGDPSRPDPFADATRHLIENRREVADVGERVPFELDVDGWRDALTGGAGLVEVEAEFIPWTMRLDLPNLRALYSSMIAVRRRRARERERILDTLVSHAAREFNGLVERPFVTALYTGRRPT